MREIIKRLLESKKSSTLSTDIFLIKDRSEEAWSLYEDIRDAVMGVVKGYDPGIDLDDDGLDSRGTTSSDRTIIYRAMLARADRKGKYSSLSNKEKNLIVGELEKLITLPESDDGYYYDVSVDIIDKTLSITLRREQK